MCTNVRCPIRRNCYRFTAEPSEIVQSYNRFKPIKTGSYTACDYFIANISFNNKNTVKIMNAKKDLPTEYGYNAKVSIVSKGVILTTD